jgi:proteasome lid subunit RPN8/RPN11
MGEEPQEPQAAHDAYEAGDIVWCRVAGRPWWPCVAFASWDEVRAWELPVDTTDRLELTETQFVACFLRHYELAVFETDSADVRPWERVPDVLESDEAVQEQLLKAIAEARSLNALRLQTHRPHSRDLAPLRLPRTGPCADTWDACLFAVQDLERPRDIQATVARALKLAVEAKVASEVTDGLRQCVNAPDASLARLRALGILQDALGEPFADEPQQHAPTLAELLTERIVNAGDMIIIEISGVDTARGEIDREGRVIYAGTAFRTVEGFVDKARQDRGARRDRRPDFNKAWAQVVHAKTGLRLHALLRQPSKRRRPPQAVSGRPPRVRGKMTANYTGYTYCGNSWWTRDDLMADRSVRQRTLKAADAPRQRRRKPTPKALPPRPPPSPVVDESTPLADYWLEGTEEDPDNVQAPVEGVAAPVVKTLMRGDGKKVWDEGYFTDAGYCDGPFADELHANAFDVVDAGTRARRRPTARRDASLRVAQLMEGLSAHQFDPHALMTCEAYGLGHNEQVDMTDEDEQESERQPLSLRVHPDVAFLCDLHAHLCDAEIIGLLGGRWDPETQEMHVQAPFPCRSVARDDDGATDVEMDPVSELQVREVIRGRDLDVVGWYHSHPRFMAEPSVTDIENQRQYQSLFADDATDGPAPFVGLIVGTYDQAATGPRSVFRYFHVAPPPEEIADSAGTVLPMALRAQVRSYKRGVSDDARARRREGFKDPPPKPPSAEMPFAFLKAGHLLGCVCCPPDARPTPVAAACAPFPPPPPVEEAPVKEAPAEEAPVEEALVEEAPVEEAPVEEAPVEEAPVEAPVEAPPPVVAPVPEPVMPETAPAVPPAPPTMSSLLPPAPAPVPAPEPAPSVPPAPALPVTLTLKLGGATVNAETIGGMAAPPPPAPPPPQPAFVPKPKKRPVYAPVYYQPRAPKVRNRSIVGPSLGPRDSRGNFPCPAGCPRTFAHAPAAVQHGKSCTAGPNGPVIPGPGVLRKSVPRVPRMPRPPVPPRERQFACERDRCVALVCEAARDKLDPALRARHDDGSGRRTTAAWEALLAKYDPTPLASCVHTLGQLARYYSTHARRVDLLENWRQGITKWEKMMNSMAVWVLKMLVEEADRADFLADVMGYVLVCWCDSSAPRRRRGR